MVTPLGPGYRARVLWQDTADPPPGRPTATLPADGRRRRRGRRLLRAGGGRASWPRRGRSVAVLDAHDLGWGASTRNGGMVLPELKAGPRIARAGRTASSGCASTPRSRPPSTTSSAVIAEGSIDCAYERSGQLYLSHGERVGRATSTRWPTS